MHFSVSAVAQGAAILAGLYAAWLWYSASRIETPTQLTPIMDSPIAGGTGFELEIGIVLERLREQSLLNAKAASWTAGSIILQALSLLPL